MKASNLFEAIPGPLPEEFVEVLAEGRGRLRVVRLVSRGHASPDGFWYDQPEHEWVVLLRGSARLSFEDAATGEVRELALAPGDWIAIPPRARHRVEATDPDEDTLWLAVHWEED
jgi:cupin 2 domain-containing protein